MCLSSCPGQSDTHGLATSSEARQTGLSNPGPPARLVHSGTFSALAAYVDAAGLFPSETLDPQGLEPLRESEAGAHPQPGPPSAPPWPCFASPRPQRTLSWPGGVVYYPRPPSVEW